MTLAPDRRIGLARALSKLGFCSRSQAAMLIREGRVALNGIRRRDPEAFVDLRRDHISVDGVAVLRATPVYLMLNKPRGVVTTAADEKGRQSVLDLLPPGLPWMAPVGRLDKASEGLLLLTNDSEWGARITDPSTHLNKTYHVQIAALADAQLLDRLRTPGPDGKPPVKRVSVVRAGKKNCWLEVVLDEGKNRQIRRIFEALNIEVLRLVRISVGPLALGNLPKGSHRAVSSAEKRQMDLALGLSP